MKHFLVRYVNEAKNIDMSELHTLDECVRDIQDTRDILRAICSDARVNRTYDEAYDEVQVSMMFALDRMRVSETRELVCANSKVKSVLTYTRVTIN